MFLARTFVNFLEIIDQEFFAETSPFTRIIYLGCHPQRGRFAVSRSFLEVLSLLNLSRNWTGINFILKKDSTAISFGL